MTVIVGTTASDAYSVMNRGLTNIRAQCESWVTVCQTDGLYYDVIHSMYVGLRDARQQLVDYGDTTGLNQFAKDQREDQTYDFIAEAQASAAEMLECYTWLNDNIDLTVTLKPMAEWNRSDGPGSEVQDFYPSGSTGVVQGLLQDIIDSITLDTNG